MSELLSPKQQLLLSLLKHGQLRRINLLHGSVRSGKTHVSLLLWACWVSAMPADGAYLMVGKTLLSLKRNILEPLAALVGRANFSYSLSKKEGVLFGRRMQLEGAADARSETKIRGMTLMGAYCDELSLFTEEFFTMLLSRLSKKGARLFATTNPDNPGHWLKVNYLDRADELDLLAVKFTLDDNPFLDPAYVASLKAETTGLFYERFILGNWVSPQGRVYPGFSQEQVADERQLTALLGGAPALCCAGVDFGGSGSATAFVLTAVAKGCREVCVLDEYYDDQNLSAESVIEAFLTRAARWKKQFPAFSAAYCDSAEQLLIKSIRARCTSCEVKNARKGEIGGRIYLTNRLIAQRRLHVGRNCPALIRALNDAVWSSVPGKADVRADDGTSNIDSLDAFEYSIERSCNELLNI